LNERVDMGYVCRNTCRGVRFISACMSKLSNSNSTSHITTLLSYSTGGLYTQSGDNRYSQDNSTETEI